jgi:2-(1,2-epoxy-1,2-dihydrophenyl)acetyl-CoA isomerase
VVATDELQEQAHAYAARLAAMPTRALGLTRRAVYRATTSTFDDALEYEAQLQQHAAASEDHVEGVMAFLEKRDAVFTGR